MSAMANATPIVTTVMKNANNEKAPDATSRVNILDFCEEHYEDILLIIMEKARHDKRKKKTRLQDSTSGQAGRTRETPLTVEVIPSVGNIPKLKTASGASKNYMAILTLGGPGPSIEIDLVMKIDSAA
ncbi:hypothetical protein Tco_0579079 [Tanacetum coccineum]